MKVVSVLLVSLLFCFTAFTQTDKTSRTKKRQHGKVDSVSSWQARPDSARLDNDSLHKR